LNGWAGLKALAAFCASVEHVIDVGVKRRLNGNAVHLLHLLAGKMISHSIYKIAPPANESGHSLPIRPIAGGSHVRNSPKADVISALSRRIDAFLGTRAN
jgi:hypothetical protein